MEFDTQNDKSLVSIYLFPIVKVFGEYRTAADSIPGRIACLCSALVGGKETGSARSIGRMTLMDGGREYKEYRAYDCGGSGGAVVVESADDWGEVSSVMIDERWVEGRLHAG